MHVNSLYSWLKSSLLKYATGIAVGKLRSLCHNQAERIRC